MPGFAEKVCCVVVVGHNKPITPVAAFFRIANKSTQVIVFIYNTSLSGGKRETPILSIGSNTCEPACYSWPTNTNIPEGMPHKEISDVPGKSTPKKPVRTETAF